VRGSASPNYDRQPRGSLVDAVETKICELLRDFPTMPATVIAERIGWEHGVTILRDRVAGPASALSPPRPVPAHLLLSRRAGPARPVAARGSHPARLRPVREALGGHLCQRVLAVHGGVMRRGGAWEASHCSATLCNCVQLCATVYNCVQLCITVYNCVQLCTTVYNCVTLCISLFAKRAEARGICPLAVS